MNFLSIRGRLVMTSFILVTLFILGLGYAYFALNSIDGNMEEISDEFLPLSTALIEQLSAEIEQQDALTHAIDSFKHGGVGESALDDHEEEAGHDEHGHETGTPEEIVAALFAGFDENTAAFNAVLATTAELIEESHDAEEVELMQELNGDLTELLAVRANYRLATQAIIDIQDINASEELQDERADALDSVRDNHNSILQEMVNESLGFSLKETTDAKESGEIALLLLLYLAGFIIALVALFSYLSVASVTAPIETINTALIKLRGGDDMARTGYTGGDELQTLGFTLDNLLDERRDSQNLDVEQSDQLNNSIMNVLRSVSVLGKGDLTEEVPMAEDITGALGDAINQMTENMIETLELVTESSDNVLNVSSNVNNMAQSGKESVVKNTEAMNEIRNTIQETAKRIKRLGERSQDINSIVKVINDISERTSVLALNANMQAAAAGEAGRGFMVVANEVQRLAESSQEATKQIGKLVNTIQTETGDTIVAMDKGIEEVVKGAELAEEAAEQMDRTVQTIENLNRVGAQLKASVSTFKLPESA